MNKRVLCMNERKYYLAYQNDILVAAFDGKEGSEMLDNLLDFCDKENVEVKLVSEFVYHREKELAGEKEIKELR